MTGGVEEQADRQDVYERVVWMLTRLSLASPGLSFTVETRLRHFLFQNYVFV